MSTDDADADDNPLKVTLSVTHGTLTLGSIAELTFEAGSGVDDAAMTFTGTLTVINAALNGLIYQPDTGYIGGGYPGLHDERPGV